MTDAPPIDQAKAWLHDWAQIGGAVTIGPSGNLVPWRYVHVDTMDNLPVRVAHAERAAELLGYLVSHIELIEPIRVMLSTEARATARRALGDIL